MNRGVVEVRFPQNADLGDGEDLFDNALGIGKLMRFDVRRVDGWSINSTDTLDGGIEVIEGVFLNESRDLSGDAAEGLRFVDETGFVGLFDGFDDGVLVKWADGAEIDDLGVDSVLGLENFSSFEAAEDACAVSNEGDVSSFTFDVGFAERNGEVTVGGIWDIALVPVKSGVFHDVDGVVVTDRCFHEAFGIGRSSGRANFEAGEGGEEALGRV